MCNTLDLQITGRKQQTPDGSAVLFRLIKHNLFINGRVNTFSRQKILHCYFYIWFSLPDKWLFELVLAQ